jgi:ubiquinone/menaquinone biosynthesis C-methylase UbiE
VRDRCGGADGRVTGARRGRRRGRVVCHTSLCHIPEPERALAEARRVTAEGGALAVFDGDYASTTVATSACDPLQACADALVAGGRLGETAAQALKDEARRRAERGEFFGHIAYASVIATRGPS